MSYCAAGLTASASDPAAIKPQTRIYLPAFGVQRSLLLSRVAYSPVTFLEVSNSSISWLKISRKDVAGFDVWNFNILLFGSLVFNCGALAALR